MKPRDPRATHDWQIRVLTAAQLEKIRELTGYSGPDGLSFFEEAVWWWRPLFRILGKGAHAIEIPHASKRGFFPESTFREMKELESSDGIEALFEMWFLHELAARIEGAFSIWPAFTMTPSHPLDNGPPFGEVPSHLVDLRKTDDELSAEFKKNLPAIRARHKKSSPWEVPGKRNKSSYLTLSTFGIIEMIDRKKSGIGDPVEDGAWANVNAAVRKRKNILSRE